MRSRIRQRGFVRLMPPVGLWATGVPQISLTISANTDNYNVFTAAGSPTARVRVYLTINASITVGSTSTATYALSFGSGWHAQSQVFVTANSPIKGRGGAGGAGNSGAAGSAGVVGGPAIDASAFPTAGNILFTNNNVISSGGGGGPGGGGAHFNAAEGFGKFCGDVIGVTNVPGGAGGIGAGSQGSAAGGSAGGSSGPYNSCCAGVGGITATGGTGGAGGALAATSSAGGSGSATGSGCGQAAYGTGATAAAGNAVNGDSKINWVVLGTINGARVG